jgi:hypothetical protein
MTPPFPSRVPVRLLAASLAFLPSAARACTVCFGAESPNLARGLFWGVVVLLVLPPALILSFAGVIAYHVRKNRRAASPIPAE